MRERTELPDFLLGQLASDVGSEIVSEKLLESIFLLETLACDGSVKNM
jgi:hypothetical protein